MQFSEVLKDLMLDKNTNVQQISKETGIDDSVIYDYLYGSVPNIKFAMILANYFNCSLNFLMGIDEEPNSYKFKTDYDISVFSKRYDALLDEFKISHYKLSKEKKLNYSSHYAWQHGAVPSMNSLIIISRYFGVSIDYLVGRTDIK